MTAIAACLAGVTLACLLLAYLCRRRLEVEEQDRRYFNGEDAGAKKRALTRRWLPRTRAATDAVRARQLADALPLVAEMLRGGASPESAFATVASCAADPLGGELSRAAREVAAANRTLPQALDSLAKRTKDATKDADLDLLASAVTVQKDGGGNLADVLDSLALTVQKKTEMRGHVEAITSSARMSATLVGCLPPVLLALLSLASPSYMADFWASGVWPGILALVTVLDLTGLAVIRRLYDLDLS